MDRLPLIINGADFTADAKRFGYSITYEKRTGRNGGMMLDGSIEEDVIAWKAAVVWRLNDLTADRIAALNTAITSASVTATFWDDFFKRRRENVPVIADISMQNLKVITPSGVRYYSGMVLTLREV